MGAADADFTGQVAVVTGAGSGIGRSTALLLARLGAAVHAADLDEQRVKAVVAEIVAGGGRGTAHVTDVGDPTAVEALAERVFAADGAVDVLHNNAGVGHVGPVDVTTLEEWQRVIGVNLMGVIHGTHCFVPRMLRQGRPAHVVNTASMAGLMPVAEMVPYATSKHAVVGLSESLNAELGPRGINVSAVCPGFVTTSIVTDAQLGGEHAERRDQIQRFYERFGCSPDVVAEAVVDAVRRKMIIRTVPRRHVVPGWALRRISPRAAQPLARLSVRMASRLG
jgi:NAD(P)-dependent dehydrogenase (short-subunit alcohol dehydrogenase family)